MIYFIDYDSTSNEILGFLTSKTQNQKRGTLKEVTKKIFDKESNFTNNNKIVLDGSNISFEKVDFKTQEEKVNDAKRIKVALINTSCGLEITSGFLSDALEANTFYKYEGEQTDQLNLIGLVTSGNDDLLKSGLPTEVEDEAEVENEIVYIWEFRPHTVAQLKKVFDDGVNYKKGLLFKAMTLKAEIAKATTVDAVNAIVWA